MAGQPDGTEPAIRCVACEAGAKTMLLGVTAAVATAVGMLAAAKGAWD